MLVQHTNRKALMTLAVSQRKSKRKLILTLKMSFVAGQILKQENYERRKTTLKTISFLHIAVFNGFQQIISKLSKEQENLA